MTVDRFVEERRAAWDELRTLVDAAHGRAERLGPERVRRLGTLYRAATADLSIARRRYGLDPLLPPLEELVGRARHLVYASVARREAVRDFVATRYWQRIRERPLLLGLAVGIMGAPAVLALIWARVDPGHAGGLVPGVVEGVTRSRPNGASVGLSTPESTAAAFQIFTNNIGVAFAALAGGMTGGLLTVISLAFNGAMLGVVAGLASGAGTTSVMVQLIVPHGVLELSCIAVAGAAGLRLAEALLAPGTRSRADAFATEGRAAAEIALGTAPWFVVAGLIEGYVTPQGIGVPAAVAVGVGAAAVFWGLTWWRGAKREPEPSA